MRKVYIYKIICPITNDIKYVGKTLRLNRRIQEHNMRKNKSKLSLIEKWENDLLSNNFKPVFEIIEECFEENWEEREIFWIKKLKDDGHDLLNMTLGGDSFNNVITKNHNSFYLKGKKLEDYYSEEKSKEIRYKLSEASSGENNPNYGGKLQTLEYMNKQIISNSKVHIKLIDTLDNNKEYIFINSKEAAKFSNSTSNNVRTSKGKSWKLKRRYFVKDL